MTDEPTTRERLVTTATRLFRKRGYDGTGVAEILAEAGVPKGSLYHHFPEGKADLACAAADWTATEICRVIDDSFRASPDWRHGVTTFSFKMAKLFDILDSADACPIFGLMFEGPNLDRFRGHAEAAFDRIISTAAGQAQTLGAPPDDAKDMAETFLIAFQGSWTLARMRRDANVLRRLPQRLFGIPND
jgi:TetR/AcrR family transcriptional repressor of lmrAB and yxaGH operons